MADAATARALKGIRVLDFGGVYSVPYAATILAAFGADVIKVETRNRLDATRASLMSQGATLTTADNSYNYVSVNLGKLAIALNLKQPKAIELAKRLAGISDVVVDSFRPGVMDRLGLGYEDLRKVRPDIIVLSLSTSGAAGPERNYGGYAGIFAALGGLAEATGYPDGIPTEFRGTIDMRIGTTAALSILIALNYRQRTGRGQFIDHSAREGITTLIGDLLMDYEMTGRNQSRVGNRDAIMAPHGVYPCRGDDAWVSIAVSTDEEWQALCRTMGHAELAMDERFAQPFSRWSHQDDLDRLVGEWTAGLTPWEVTGALQRAGVAAMPSMSSVDLFDDPHLKERQLWLKVNQRQLGPHYTLSVPWSLSRTPVSIDGASPVLAEHNAYVFCNLLGLAPDVVRALEEEGICY